MDAFTASVQGGEGMIYKPTERVTKIMVGETEVASLDIQMPWRVSAVICSDIKPVLQIGLVLEYDLDAVTWDALGYGEEDEPCSTHQR